MLTRTPLSFLVFAALVLAFVPRVSAQVVNPANQGPSSEQPAGRLHTYEMPPVTVEGKASLFEEDLIGDYAQPRWTAHRRFGETRVYVIPKGMVEFEYWLRPTTPKDGPTKFETQYEAEFGLPGRFQLDLYAVGHKEGKEGAFAIDAQKVEVRWAFADWGKIWGNPALYAEWQESNNGPDVAEGKLLMGGHLVSKWHWGSNLVWEQETGAARERSLEWTTGWSYSASDSKVAVGAETKLAFVTEIENLERGDASKELLVGPSVQFRPLPQMHIDLAPLFGVTHDAPRSQVFVVLGWEL